MPVIQVRIWTEILTIHLLLCCFDFDERKKKKKEPINTDDDSFKVTILYFGRLRELTNTSSEKINFDSTITYTQQTILDRIIEHRSM